MKTSIMRMWTRNFSEAIKPEVCVVLASYNNPRELRLCLEGYRRQSFWIKELRPFQLILADDGSDPVIERIFLQFSKEVNLPMTFLYQQHRGWGKLRMLNWAVLESKAEKMIFTDGDCVPHKHFVKVHMDHYDDKTVCCGRRVDLNENIAASLTLENMHDKKLGSMLWYINHMIRREMKYGEQGFFLPKCLSQLVSFFSVNKSPTIIGSNFSLNKKWLLAINGFDESFQAPGLGEDSDIERRLKLLGLEFKWVTRRAIQYHLSPPLQHAGEQSILTFKNHKTMGNIRSLKGLEEVRLVV